MLLAAIRKFIDPVEELENTFTSLKDWVKGLGGGVTKILDGVRGSLEACPSANCSGFNSAIFFIARLKTRSAAPIFIIAEAVLLADFPV